MCIYVYNVTIVMFCILHLFSFLILLLFLITLFSFNISCFLRLQISPACLFSSFILSICNSLFYFVSRFLPRFSVRFSHFHHCSALFSISTSFLKRPFKSVSLRNKMLFFPELNLFSLDFLFTESPFLLTFLFYFFWHFRAPNASFTSLFSIKQTLSHPNLSTRETLFTQRSLQGAIYLLHLADSFARISQQTKKN